MDRRWLWCGVAAALLAPAAVALGGASWSGYSHVTQTISELVARDAPGRATLSALFIIYNGLLWAFGLALRDLAASRGPAGRLGLRAGDHLRQLAALGVLLLAVPMDPAGGPRTPIGLTHTLIAGLMAVAAASAALWCGRWLSQEPGMVSLARLSRTTVGLMTLFGLLTVAGSRLEMLGLMERLLTGAFEVWMALTAVGLYRATGEARHSTSYEQQTTG